MPRSSPFIIRLTDEQRRILEARARKYTLSYRDVFRAQMMLLAAQGLRNDEIAARLNTRREIVSKWRKRFFEEGMAGLDERLRRGRPRVFSPLCRRGDQGAGL
jgi:DNA-binding CsgD family transcriptional regulator